MNCLICGNDYRHLGAHVAQKHELKARDYKIKFGLDISHSLIDPEVKEKKRRAFFNNPTLDNLQKGAPHRIKKGEVKRTYFSAEFRQNVRDMGLANLKTL